MSTKTKGHRGIWLSVWCVVLALVIGFNCWATSYALSWDKVLTGYFGIIETKGQEQAETTQETSENKYATLEELAVAEKEAELEIVSEGMVLLKNDNDALPLAKGSKVSVFGQTAQMWMTKEKLTNTKDTVFLESLEAAGLEINGTLRKMYKQSKHTKWGNGANLGNGGIAGAWAVKFRSQNTRRAPWPPTRTMPMPLSSSSLAAEARAVTCPGIWTALAERGSRVISI